LTILQQGEYRIFLFKKIYPTSRLKKSRIPIFKELQNFNIVDSDILAIDAKVHIASDGEIHYIISLKVFEDNFGFSERLENITTTNINLLRESSSINLPDSISASDLSKKMQKKLASILKHNPIAESKKLPEVPDFYLKYCGGRPVTWENGTLQVTTKKQFVNLIRILNRDLNTNELTLELFDTSSKKLIDPETFSDDD